MITIKNFTELKSDPRGGGISAADFGASKFCSHINAASKLVAIWGYEANSKLISYSYELAGKKIKVSKRGEIIAILRRMLQH